MQLAKSLVDLSQAHW